MLAGVRRRDRTVGAAVGRAPWRRSGPGAGRGTRVRRGPRVRRSTGRPIARGWRRVGPRGGGLAVWPWSPGGRRGRARHRCRPVGRRLPRGRGWGARVAVRRWGGHGPIGVSDWRGRRRPEMPKRAGIRCTRRSHGDAGRHGLSGPGPVLAVPGASARVVRGLGGLFGDVWPQGSHGAGSGRPVGCTATLGGRGVSGPISGGRVGIHVTVAVPLRRRGPLAPRGLLRGVPFRGAFDRASGRGLGVPGVGPPERQHHVVGNVRFRGSGHLTQRW